MESSVEANKEIKAISPKERGERVRHIRESVLRYSREKFGKKYGIPAASLQNWEIGKYGGLTEKAAIKLVKAFNAEGVSCTVEWLLYGLETQSPELKTYTTPNLPTNANSNSSNITHELRVFHQLNANAIDAIVADNSMEPCFVKGDLVAGVRYFDDDINKVIGENCILQTTTGELLIRHLNLGTKSGVYTLSCINPKSTVNNSVIKDISLFSAAPIIWFRRVPKF